MWYKKIERIVEYTYIIDPVKYIHFPTPKKKKPFHILCPYLFFFPLIHVLTFLLFNNLHITHPFYFFLFLCY